MTICGCSPGCWDLACDRFRDHVREQLATAVNGALKVERLDDESHEARVLVGDPEAPRPQGIINAGRVQ